MPEHQYTPLGDHIAEHHDNNASQFAREMGVTRQNVYHYLKRGFVIIAGQLYGPVRELPEKGPGV